MDRNALVAAIANRYPDPDAAAVIRLISESLWPWEGPFNRDHLAVLTQLAARSLGRAE